MLSVSFYSVCQKWTELREYSGRLFHIFSILEIRAYMKLGAWSKLAIAYLILHNIVDSMAEIRRIIPKLNCINLQKKLI